MKPWVEWPTEIGLLGRFGLSIMGGQGDVTKGAEALSDVSDGVREFWTSHSEPANSVHPVQNCAMSQATPGFDAPGPNADDFNPKNHIWDGTHWWTQDRSRWWDGNRWQAHDYQPTQPVSPPTIMEPGTQPSQPQYSPDGRFYWDGQHWVPSPQAKAAVSRLAGALVCGGAAGVIIGTFLPWLSASAAFVGTISRDLISSGDGQFLAGVAAVGGLIGLWLLLRGPSVSGGILVLLLAVVAGFILVIDYQDVSQRVANVTAGTSLIVADVGPGPYLSGLGLLIWALGGVVALFGRQKVKR